MPLAEALPRLEALVEAAGEVEETAAAEERQCDLCWNAPRSVRFACGHALYCETCVPRVLERDTNCPTCRQPALPIAATGTQVAAQTTFVYQPPSRPAPQAQPVGVTAAVGRRGGRGGRGRGGRGGRGAGRGGSA
ncbi:hypothetical protein EMIHUDRAFT_316144 [Emiliania huxleyi CCMP1516]|uniref:RING-type domain-containing protein n=2 Tax=Emiliania huxleyi TaxID=2903 RepID=A0A0D3J772_EMIH1|nr:hypothetical protein EMIHUDRAFT_316144 [Emiliania huxleyi CCMP1516]EOD19357.1 hypothetical protein EMIHUDRAFT_316144 [Emiliania huxleyi CCMP1516]|eukprot:XP_005771786.1 hypothetical protein EMIHUDRAFT_316144 [Emiliania huxleyi CCMP1516]